MFDKLKNAFKNLGKALKEKKLSEKEVKSILEDLQFELISNDVASPVAKEIAAELQDQLIGKRVKRLSNPEQIVQNTLEKKILEMLQQGQGNLLKTIQKKAKANLSRIKSGKEVKPYKIMFIGPNGAGKTTSIAKLAWKLKQEEISSVLVGSDTFRAGAQEQLKKHAEALELPIISGEYGKDPASVGYDAINFAKSKRVSVILIDTAGRLGGDINLIQEMQKMDRIIEPDIKIFVGSALSGNELARQTKKFQEGITFEGNILTKVDADVKGGAALTLAYSSKAPIYFIGTGQKYEDLQQFNPEWFAEMITEW